MPLDRVAARAGDVIRVVRPARAGIGDGQLDIAIDLEAEIVVRPGVFLVVELDRPRPGHGGLELTRQRLTDWRCFFNRRRTEKSPGSTQRRRLGLFFEGTKN